MLNTLVAQKRANMVRLELATIDLRNHGIISPAREVTCEKCQYNDACEYAWDLYNTDGDCLAMK